MNESREPKLTCFSLRYSKILEITRWIPLSCILPSAWYSAKWFIKKTAHWSGLFYVTPWGVTKTTCPQTWQQLKGKSGTVIFQTFLNGRLVFVGGLCTKRLDPYETSATPVIFYGPETSGAFLCHHKCPQLSPFNFSPVQIKQTERSSCQYQAPPAKAITWPPCFCFAPLQQQSGSSRP